MKLKLLFVAFIAISFLFSACNPDEGNLDQALGWFGDTEDTDHIEDAVNIGHTFGSGNLPSSVDLSAYFPPIGDQGQYGTCVAWAVGYNHKSFLEAKSRGETYYNESNKLFSPKDLFWSIDNSYKGEDCNGTNFEYAYDILLSRGIATLATVPYENLGDCSSSPSSEWTNDAANHKISNYREIDVDKETIKSYLADGRAVVFGAKLGDEFMNYTGGVLDYQTYGYTGQHAYHAMILCGYDDSQGTNGAFRVVNSWGTSWGDNGYAWVDEDYFCTDDFCFCAFVATDQLTDPDEDGDNEVDDDDISSGYDLIAWELYDQDYNDPDDPDSDDPRWRTSVYNVYNAGKRTLYASDDWCIVYLLYNAYDGDDYQILLFDYYSDDYGSVGENGNLDDPNITSQIPSQGYWWNNVDVASGQSVADAVFGGDDPFHWTYRMPDVTGDYYLIIYADAFDTYSEADESNNFTYFADENGDPIHIENGVIQNAPAKRFIVKTEPPAMGDDADMESVRTEKHLNTYTTQEIAQKLMYDRKTGILQKKIMEYLSNSSKNKRKYN